MSSVYPPLPKTVEYKGFTYILSDEPIQHKDWYIDHQLYIVGRDYLQECNIEGLAEFLNEDRPTRKWFSKKIISTDDPVLNYYGVKYLET